MDVFFQNHNATLIANTNNSTSLTSIIAQSMFKFPGHLKNGSVLLKPTHSISISQVSLFRCFPPIPSQLHFVFLHIVDFWRNQVSCLIQCLTFWICSFVVLFYLLFYSPMSHIFKLFPFRHCGQRHVDFLSFWHRPTGLG